MMTAGIAGDGIIGQLLAFALLNAGWNVTIYGPGKKNNCSMTAAGLLTPVAELEKSDVIIFQLTSDAITQHWPAILNTLPKNIYFRQQGSLVLSHPKDQTDLKRFINIISNKLNNSNYYQLLNHSELSALEPDMAHFYDGYYFPCEAQIDNQTLLKEIKNSTKKITRVKKWVSDVQPGKMILNNEINHFDMAFDCRGLGAQKHFSDLRGVRGELIWLHAPDVSIQRPIRYAHPRYSVYIVPRPNHVYLLGASEIETDHESPISVRTTLELLTAAYSLQPKFAEARIIKTATHCRPTLSNHLPKIKYADQFIAINGLYRHGFMISPTLVDDVMQFLQHGISAVRYPQLFEKMEGNI